MVVSGCDPEPAFSACELLLSERLSMQLLSKRLPVIYACKRSCRSLETGERHSYLDYVNILNGDKRR